MSIPPQSQQAPQIPEELALEIRRLAHDLSNALEIIIQASYLLQMTNPEAQAKRWATMVDQGAQQAATINRKLREYIRNQKGRREDKRLDQLSLIK